MKNFLVLIKQNYMKYIFLFICIIFFNYGRGVLVDTILPCINYHIPLAWHTLLFPLIVFAISLIGILIVALHFCKNYKKAQLLLNLCILALVAITINIGYNFMVNGIAQAIYNSITGSIATAKIIIDSTGTIFKVPIDALLLCLLGNLILNGKIISKITWKKYYTILIACLIVWIIRFIFLLVPNGLFMFVMQNIIVGIAITLLVAIALYKKENI